MMKNKKVSVKKTPKKGITFDELFQIVEKLEKKAKKDPSTRRLINKAAEEFERANKQFVL